MGRGVHAMKVGAWLCVMGLAGAVFAQEKVQTAVDRTGWEPWVNNSIQPAPAFEAIQLPATTAQPGDGPTETICRAAIAWFDEAVQHVDEMVPAAEAAAEHMMAGGRIYCTGSPGFVQEVFDRAGGFAYLSEWKGETLTANDILLIGQFTPRDEGVGYASIPGIGYQGGWNIPGQVVRVSSHNWVEMSRTLPLVRAQSWGGRLYELDSRAPEGGSWSDVSLGQMSAAATVWAFQGEVFAAATRKGKVLTTEGSDLEPFGKDWDKTFKPNHLNSKFNVPPIPAGQLGRMYLKTAQKQMAQFLLTGQAKQVRLAGKRLANTMQDGNAVWVVVTGHIHQRGDIVPRELPRMVMYGRSWQWRADILKPGDAMVWVGYLDYPKEQADAAVKAGANVVTLSVADGPSDERRTHIASCWENWDSAVNVTGYPVRILPTSGVVQTVQWYSLVAETLQEYQAMPKKPVK